MNIVTFGILNTVNGNLLSVENEHSFFEDGDCIYEDNLYSIEDGGSQGQWRTESLFTALIMLYADKYQSSESIPRISNKHDKMKVVAIHSFNGVDVIQEDNIPQDISKLINSDSIILGNFLNNELELDQVSYSFYTNCPKENGRLFTLDYSIVYKLENYFKKEGLLPVVLPDISYIIKHCEETLMKAAKLN